MLLYNPYLKWNVNTLNIGNRIIFLREQLNLTQLELSKQVNLNVSVLNRIESNARPLRDVEIINIAKVLNVSTDFLLGVTDNHKTKDSKYIKDESLMEWYDQLPFIKESDLKRLRDIWEIICRK